MSDNQDVAAARDGITRHRPPAGLVMPGAGTDLSAVARLIVDDAVPRFADAAGVYVLEQLLSADHPAGPATAADVVVRRLSTGFAGAGRLVREPAFPSGEVIAFAPGSPYARCVRDETPVVFGQPDGATLERATPGARQVLARYASFLATPMTARDTPVGLLLLARTAGAPAFDDPGTAVAARLAARAGTGIASSLALLRPVPSRLEIAGRCLPAAGYDIGGDWYDVIPLPRGRTGLIVGDVMGHGNTAAALMGQVRAAAYALASMDLPPDEVLWQLNRTVLALPHSPLATCAYAIIDTGGQSCAIATAGHLPPVLAMPDGATRVPGLPGGPSLGIGPAGYARARLTLRPGTVLALYTDGLVETRTRPFDQGILALRSLLSREHPDLDLACEELITSLSQRHEDDITVVLARIPTGATA